MRQRYKLYSLLMAAPLLMAGCSDDEATVGISSNREAISICTGISTSTAGVETRALELAKNGYYAFQEGTQISLRTEGTWTGKTNPSIVKVSTATTSAKKTKDKGDALKNYNDLSIASSATPLYWDDFGTADPANKDTGRKDGLTMYAAAVDGLTTGGPVISATDNTIAWDVTAAQNADEGWSKKDLLISNNIKNGTSDNRYKFADKATAANLIFNHAMSRITVNLYRGAGFTETEVTTGLTAEVKVLQMSTAGKVDVTTGAVSDLGTKADVAPHLDEHKTSCAAEGNIYSTYSALVYPGNTFGTTTDVLKITVNDNTYNVNGTEIIKAAEGSTSTAIAHTLKAGTNYIFNITVSKTGLNITAQIAPWTEYNAENETPLLNIDANREDTYTGTTVMPANFQLYYSASATTAYTTSKMFGNANAPVEVQATKGSDGTYSYSFIEGGNAINLYWPNHITPYNFRGVVALKDADNSNIKETVTDGTKVSDITYGEGITRATEANKIYYPTVVKGDAGDYVDLTSGKDDKNNVLIGTHANTVNGNNANGAIATTGKVRLTFYHKMAHVTVLLRTTGASDADKVNLGTSATDMAKVEVLSYKKDGKVMLGNGTVTATGDAADYIMPAMSTTYSTTSTDNYYSRASYMVPQTLGDDMVFKVTITNTDGTTDTYTSVKINTINVQTGSSAAAPATAWDEGCKYVYTLTIKKTGINVTAVLKPWTEYTGSTVVPFM